MRKQRLENMKGGWFVGNFTPTFYKTNVVEVAVKTYIAGARESLHGHKIATEITVIVNGQAEMNGQLFAAGDMIMLEPGDYSDFVAITDVVTAVVKIPSVNDDKYIIEKDLNA